MPGWIPPPFVLTHTQRWSNNFHAGPFSLAGDLRELVHLSLTPGFSPVNECCPKGSRFNGFQPDAKTVETVYTRCLFACHRAEARC